MLARIVTWTTHQIPYLVSMASTTVCGAVGFGSKPEVGTNKMTDVDKEKHNRTRLSLAAYSYEFDNRSIMSDGEFDKLALQINPQVATGNDKLDKFFREHFDPSTGMWIHKHPELQKLRELYERLYLNS